MKVETNYKLVADNGQYVEQFALIYDRKDGQFVGKFLAFNGGNIVVMNKHSASHAGVTTMGFPLDCVKEWTEKPLPTKPPAVWPESLRRFFRAAHKSEDAKQIALALKAVDLWMRGEVYPVEDDPIPF